MDNKEIMKSMAVSHGLVKFYIIVTHKMVLFFPILFSILSWLELYGILVQNVQLKSAASTDLIIV